MQEIFSKYLVKNNLKVVRVAGGLNRTILTEYVLSTCSQIELGTVNPPKGSCTHDHGEGTFSRSDQ